MEILNTIKYALVRMNEEGVEPSYQEVAIITGINEDTVLRVLLGMAKKNEIEVTVNSGSTIKPRKKKTIDITETTSLFRSYGTVGNYDDYQALVPNWVDDMLRGSIMTNMGNGTQKISTYRLFKLMCSINKVNTDTVTALINPSHVNKEGVSYSNSTIEYYTNAIIGTHNRVQHNLPNFDNKPKTEGYVSEGMEGTLTPMQCYLESDKEPVIKEILTDSLIDEVATKWIEGEVGTCITNPTIIIGNIEYVVDMETGEIIDYKG